MRNVPEAEGHALRVSLVLGGVAKTLYCDPEEVQGCEDAECALEVLLTCSGEQIALRHIKVLGFAVVRGGKVILYEIDGEKACLCAHRPGLDPEALCRST